MESSSVDQNIPAADIGAGGTRMSFRDELDSKRYSVVDEDWAGGVPAQYGVAPRIRIGRDKWFNLLWLIPIGLLLLVAGWPSPRACANCRRCRTSCSSIPEHPSSPRCTGRLPRLGGLAALLQRVPDDLHHPVGDHDHGRPSTALLDQALHARQGLVPDAEAGARATRCTPRSKTRSPCRTGRAARAAPFHRAGPLVAPRRRHAVAAQRDRLLRPDLRHRAVAATGADCTGTSSRTRISVAIQYLSLDWPTETGWVDYNSLQLIAYFITVFVAAPLALITGLGHVAGAVHPVPRDQLACSASRWPGRCISWCCAGSCCSSWSTSPWCSTTGALRNLNHMYAGRDDETWVGFWIFAASHGRHDRRPGWPPPRSPTGTRASCRGSASP